MEFWSGTRLAMILIQTTGMDAPLKDRLRNSIPAQELLQFASDAEMESLI